MSPTLTAVPLNAGRRRVFGSVFPATLQTSSLSEKTLNASFQSTDSSSTVKTDFAPIHPSVTSEADRETWDRAWAAATDFLSVPDRGFAPIYDARDTDGSEIIQEFARLSPPSKDTADALEYLVAAVPQAQDDSRNLFSWYGDEIRRHFLTNLRQGLHEVGDAA